MARKEEKDKKIKFYSLNKILEKDADYNVVYGERSNGKTTAVLRYGLERYIKSGYKEQLAYIRRWEEDFKGIKGSSLFNGVVSLGWVDELTKGKYNAVKYKAMAWYLCNINPDGELVELMTSPFCYGFSISSSEHYKSTPYPNITTIFFDEFITKEYYFPDEFIMFQNLLSTIIRLKDNVKIFMCGNTINKYCPYFAEMGLTNVKKQEIGTIDVYSYGDNSLKVAVEYSTMGDKKSKKPSNKYFAFDNPKLQMITNGSWEIDIYPHLPVKYTPKEVKLIYFIQFDDATLQCEIIKSKELKSYFTYVHIKTTPIKDDKSIVFNTEPNAMRNYRRNITIINDDVGKFIYSFFKNDKIFYQSNEIGEVVRNYIKWCKNSII